MSGIIINADGSVTIEGGLNVQLDGSEGDDILISTNGDDELNGGEGDDFLMAGGGDDLVNGDNGQDVLLGGAGNDILNGGMGDDLLIGGSGGDIYAFGIDSGNDVVLGFSFIQDAIDLTEAGITGMDELAFTSDANGNAVLDLGNGNSVTFVGVSVTDLQANAENLITFAEPSGPELVQLDVGDTYTDAGDGTDQIIDGDNQGEELTDTDTFVFTQNFGKDMVTDFQINTLLPDFTIVPGDILDLSAHGVFRTSFGDADTAAGVLAGYGVTLTAADVDNDGQEDSILTFADGSELTLLGIDTVEDMQIIIELQLTES